MAHVVFTVFVSSNNSYGFLMLFSQLKPRLTIFSWKQLPGVLLWMPGINNEALWFVKCVGILCVTETQIKHECHQNILYIFDEQLI